MEAIDGDDTLLIALFSLIPLLTILELYELKLCDTIIIHTTINTRNCDIWGLFVKFLSLASVLGCACVERSFVFSFFSQFLNDSSRILRK